MTLYLLRVKKSHRIPENGDGIMGFGYAKNVTQLIEWYDGVIADPAFLEVFRLSTQFDTSFILMDEDKGLFDDSLFFGSSICDSEKIKNLGDQVDEQISNKETRKKWLDLEYVTLALGYYCADYRLQDRRILSAIKLACKKSGINYPGPIKFSDNRDEWDEKEKIYKEVFNDNYC